MKLAALVALLVTLPAPAFADDRYFLFTGDGVAKGEGRVGLELSGVVVAASSVAGLPDLGIRYARGLADFVDLRLSLNTLGLYSIFDLGVGFSLVKTPSFGLGLRAGATGVVIVSEAVLGVFAGTPGLVLTLRGSSVAFSVGADLPMWFNGFVANTSGAAAATGFAFSVRPNAALEIGEGSGAKFYIHGDADLFFNDGKVYVLSNFGLGVHF